MNKKLALLAAPMMMLAASTATAQYIPKSAKWLTPYVGADLQWRHMNFRKGFGDNLFRHDYQQGNIYTGLRFWDFIGIEVGYEATNKMSKHALLHTGELSAGSPLEDTFEYNSPAHIQGPHADLVAFLPVYKAQELSLIGLVGVAHLKVHLVRHAKLVYIVTDTGAPIAVTPESVGFAPDDLFEKRKPILRLGAGLEHKFYENWGVRGMVVWENTQKFKINAQGAHSSINSVNIKNSVIYSLGAFVTF